MICTDSSVAAKWFFAEEHAPQASALLRDALVAAEPLVAPPLLPTEVTNVIRQRLRQGFLDRRAARFVLARFLELPISIQAPEALYDRALVLADEHDLPAVYDAHYLALAELLGATFWTADRRLLDALGGRLTFVRWIGDYGT